MAVYIALVVLGCLTLGFFVMYIILRLLQSVGQSSAVPVAGITRRRRTFPRQFIRPQPVDRSAMASY